MATPEVDSAKISQANEKLVIAKQKKDSGDQAFKNQEWKTALRSYHESLLYLNGIDKQSLPSIGPLPTADPQAEGGKSPRTEADEMIEKIYSNMSACHVKAENWRRALDCADRALQKNPDNFKAAFRKAKAHAALGFSDKARKTLEELKSKNPADAATIEAELNRIAVQDAESEKKANQKLRGFLSRDKSANPNSPSKPITTSSSTSSPSKPSTSRSIDEEDGDGTSSAKPILVPSGIEELDDDDDEEDKS